jgi:hypothetical protein
MHGVADAIANAPSSLSTQRHDATLPVLIPRTRQHKPQHATPPLAALRLLCRLSPPLCRRALPLPWLLRLARRGAARRSGVLLWRRQI